jgi:hypothetical protein
MRAFHARDWGSNPHSSTFYPDGSSLNQFPDSDSKKKFLGTIYFKKTMTKKGAPGS